MLPLPEVFAEALPASFVLFKPRDIVSGDFYWLYNEKHLTIVAAADCTGHGVPGAFMSMIGNDLLGQIVEHDDIFSPDLILNELNMGVRKALRQDATNNKDGMDIAICVINRLERTLEYAGAANPLCYIQDDELKEIKADKFAIGGRQEENSRIFKKHTLLLDKPTVYYIFSDGYQDQFGGENNSKFMSRRLKQLFVEIHKLPMAEQKKRMDDVIMDWIKHTRQIDDILVIGFKV
jgi:serine phosphatase RsbU (regulator of sigma subunit)